MLLQSNTSDNYDSVQQLATRVAILKGQLNLMRMDHPDRDATLTEFTSLQAQLTLARQRVGEWFGPAAGFTF